MILNDLFEGRMKGLATGAEDMETAYQSWLHSRGRGALNDREFQKEFGLSRRDWAMKNRDWIYKREQLAKSPDSHLYPERQGYRPVKKVNIHEDSDLHILYLDGRPVARFPNLEDAEEQARDIMQKYPDTEVTIQRQICKLTPVELKENLRKWFKEKWVRFNPQGKIMGPCARGSKSEGKPKCLPQAKAHALGKKGRASAAAKKRREDPNPERRGPAKNVATKVREAAGLYGPFTLTINTGERPTSRTKTKKFKREDDAILWAEDWFEDFPQYVYATAEITDPKGNVVWYSDETMTDGERVAETFARPESEREQYVQLLARTYAELYWGDRSITERIPTARAIFDAVMSGELDLGTLKMEIRALEQEQGIDEGIVGFSEDAQDSNYNTARHIGQELEQVYQDLWDAMEGPTHPQHAKRLQKSIATLRHDLAKLGYNYDISTKEVFPVQREEQLDEKQDACYHKVKSRYKVWPSAYASGALVQCRKKGAANWGTGGKKKK